MRKVLFSLMISLLIIGFLMIFCINWLYFKGLLWRFGKGIIFLS